MTLSGLNPSPTLGSGHVVDRYALLARARSKRLMNKRAAEIEADVEHLTPAGQRDKEREGGT